MDADFLRLLLFIAGVGLILGIYFWDRHKQVNKVVHAIKKAQKREEPTIDSEPDIKDDAGIEPRNEPALDARLMAEQVARSIADSANRYRSDQLPEEDVESDEVDLPPPETDAVPSEPPLQVSSDEHEEAEPFSPNPSAEDESDDDVDQALEQLEAMVQEEHLDTPITEQESFSFAADHPEDFSGSLETGNLPVKILQLNVVARNGQFCGTDIFKAVTDLQLVYGDMLIYHRYDGDPARGRVLFGMASMVEPGTIPTDNLDKFFTPGLTLFAQLPGYQDGIVVFSDMLFTAERLAVMLDGNLQDGSHSDLSRQTISHIREGILEHRRQVKLARSLKR
ncbi:MAG: cell division protein ZipA [Sedimenticola sp.]